MTKKIAFVFPGQGSQMVGMGKDLYDNFSVAKEVFDKADEILGRKISKICFEGPEEDLTQTINTQPAILVTSIAALEVLKSKLDVIPDYVAGHSLGEYGAMYSAGVLSFENALNLIQKRAEAMANTSGGSMAAILNLDEETIKSVLNSVKGYVAIANYNSLSQIVITGEDDPIKEACEKLLEAGARRAVPLAVSGAFHSSKMRTAADEFMKFEENIEINNAKIPVVTNVDAEFTEDAKDFKFKMPLQIYSAVKWTQSVQNMIKAGVDTFVEIGNGSVLSGLIRKIDKSVNTYNIYDKESLEEFVETFSKELNNVR